MKGTMKKSFNDRGIIQKKDKRTGRLEWYARIVRKDGSGKNKQYVEKAESKAHARRLRNELAEKFKDRGEDAIAGDKLTFRELADKYKEKRLYKAVYHGEGKSKRKVGGLRSVLGPLHYLEILKKAFGAKRIRNISHDDIEDFKRIRLQTPTARGVRSITDVNRNLELLRAMLRFAVRQGWLNRTPFEMGSPLISRADENRRETTLSYTDESKLLAACEGRRSHLKPLIVTAVDTAMRRGELFSLRWENVNFESRTIVITAMNSKTAKERTVGMTDRVYSELSKLWESSTKESTDSVFGIKDNVKIAFGSACKEVGITDLHFHDLRHTAITRMVAAGLPAMEIMKVSGHSQINTFARYVNPTQAAVTKIAEGLSKHNKSYSENIELDSNSIH